MFGRAAEILLSELNESFQKPDNTMLPEKVTNLLFLTKQTKNIPWKIIKAFLKDIGAHISVHLFFICFSNYLENCFRQ